MVEIEFWVGPEDFEGRITVMLMCNDFDWTVKDNDHCCDKYSSEVLACDFLRFWMQTKLTEGECCSVQ